MATPQELVEQWRTEAKCFSSLKREDGTYPAADMKLIDQGRAAAYETCARELEQALAAEAQERAELTRKAAWYDAHIRDDEMGLPDCIVNIDGLLIMHEATFVIKETPDDD